MPTFSGRVDDLDFIQALDHCQAILRSGDTDLIAVTRDPRIQSLLEAAFVCGALVEATYEEGESNLLTRVKVNREAVPPAQDPYAAAASPAGDDDPAAPAGDEVADGEEMLTARARVNFGAPEEDEGAVPGEEADVSAADAPAMDINIAVAQAFLNACLTSTPRVRYGLGAKVPRHGATPGRDFTKIDCSGFVREAIRLATTPRANFPDGSVVQHDWVRAQGFPRGTREEASARDGAVRIAFLRQQDSPTGIGHVVLVHNGVTLESHGGTGPNSRPWTNTGWQRKAFVYLLRA